MRDNLQAKLVRYHQRARNLKKKYEDLRDEFELEMIKSGEYDEETMLRRIKNCQDKIYYFKKQINDFSEF